MVKIKKTIVDKVRSLNDSGGLWGELRLAAVATPLAQLEDEAAALKILTRLEEQAETVEDPTAWVRDRAKAALEEEVEVEPEEEEWAEGAAPLSRDPDCKPGDWRCPKCNDLQFARNFACRMCGASRPEGKGGGKPGDWEQGKKRKFEEVGKGAGKPGDWTCPNCGDLVFARNQACRQCNTPRPSSRGKGKPGDWTCPSCGDFQFARNEVCRSCNAPRPFSATQSLRAAARPGDWECPKCGDLQFARNTECRQCGAPRPDDDDE